MNFLKSLIIPTATIIVNVASQNPFFIQRNKVLAQSMSPVIQYANNYTSKYLGNWTDSPNGFAGDQIKVYSNGSYQLIKPNFQGGVGRYLPGSDDVTTGNFTVNGSTILFHTQILQVYSNTNHPSTLGRASSTSNYPHNRNNDSLGILQNNILVVKDSQGNITHYTRVVNSIGPYHFSNPLSR